MILRLFVLVFCSLVSHAHEVQLKADRIILDNKSENIFAKNNISLDFDNKIKVLGNECIINSHSQWCIKDGHISLYGSNIYASHIFSDNKNGIKLRDLRYSPCTECKNGKYLWHIESHDALLNSHIYEGAYSIKFDNVKFFLYDIPIFYLPSFSHKILEYNSAASSYDASKKIKSMMPHYNSSSDLGYVLRFPIYMDISDNSYAIIAPTYASKKGYVIDCSFDQVLQYGKYHIGGSFKTNRDFKEESECLFCMSGTNVRSKHFEYDAKFSKNNWYYGAHGKITNDASYLKRYGFDNEDYLKNEFFIHKIFENTKFSAKSLDTRNITNGDRRKIYYLHGYNRDLPIDAFAIPHVSAEHTRMTHVGNFSFKYDMRPLFVKYANLILLNAASVSWHYKLSEYFDIKSSLRSDVYDSFGAFAMFRMIPEININSDFPLHSFHGENYGGSIKALLNPIFSHSSNDEIYKMYDLKGNSEISHVNLFNSNKFSGFEGSEDGLRMNYGLLFDYYSNNSLFSLLFGQNYRVKKNNSSKDIVGMKDKFSDYIGKSSFSYGDSFDAYHILRLSNNLNINYSEFCGKINYKKSSLFVKNIYSNEFSKKINNLNAGSEISFREHWRYVFEINRDMNAHRMISANNGLKYESECALLGFKISQKFNKSNGVPNSSSFSFKIIPKGF